MYTFHQRNGKAISKQNSTLLLSSCGVAPDLGSESTESRMRTNTVCPLGIRARFCRCQVGCYSSESLGGDLSAMRLSYVQILISNEFANFGWFIIIYAHNIYSQRLCSFAERIFEHVCLIYQIYIATSKLRLIIRINPDELLALHIVFARSVAECNDCIASSFISGVVATRWFVFRRSKLDRLGLDRLIIFELVLKCIFSIYVAHLFMKA